MRPHKYEHLREQAVAMMRDGKAAAVVAHELGNGKRITARWRDQAGIPKKEHGETGRRDVAVRQKAIEMLRQGYGARYIAQQVGAGKSSIRRWREEAGLTPLPSGHIRPVLPYCLREGPTDVQVRKAQREAFTREQNRVLKTDTTRHWLQHPDARKAIALVGYYANHEANKERNRIAFKRQWESNKDQIKEASRKRAKVAIDSLSDSYIKRQLMQEFGVTWKQASTLPADIIEQKRKRLAFDRQLREWERTHGEQFSESVPTSNNPENEKTT